MFQNFFIILLFFLTSCVPILEDRNAVYEKFYILCDNVKVDRVSKHPTLKLNDKLSNILMYLEFKNSFDLRVSSQSKRVFQDFDMYFLKDGKNKVRTDPTATYRYDSLKNRFDNINITFGFRNATKELYLSRTGNLLFDGYQWEVQQTWESKELVNKIIEEENYSYSSKCGLINKDTFDKY